MYIVHQLFSRENIHVLRALNTVRSGPCYCGFSEHLSKHTRNIRQMVPTSVDHRSNAKSSFCIMFLFIQKGKLSYKEISKSICLSVCLWPSVSRSLPAPASPSSCCCLGGVLRGRRWGASVPCPPPWSRSPLPSPPTSRSQGAAPQMSHSFLLSSMVSVKLGSLFMMAASALSADSAPFASLVW